MAAEPRRFRLLSGLMAASGQVFGSGAGIDTPDPEVESAEVELPPLAVVIALLLVGQIVVAQHDARPAVLRVQRDDDTGGAGGTAWSCVQPQVKTRRFGGSTSTNSPAASTPSRMRTR